MNMQEIRQLAKERGIKPGKRTKAELVKTVQRSEGNFDCYSTAVNRFCDQEGCLWRQDCLKQSIAN